MEYHAFDCFKRACEWYTDNNDRAKNIIEEFDKEHGVGWNCIVSSDSGFAHAYHSAGNRTIRVNKFGNDKISILLFHPGRATTDWFAIICFLLFIFLLYALYKRFPQWLVIMVTSVLCSLFCYSANDGRV